MIEQQLRADLHDAVTTEPAIGLDADRAISVGRQRIRHRRGVAVAAISALAVTSILTGTVLARTYHGRTDNAAVAPNTFVPLPTAPSLPNTPGAQHAQEAARRVTSQVQSDLLRAVPGIQSMGAATVLPKRVNDSDVYYLYGNVTFTDRQGYAYLGVQLTPPGVPVDRGAADECRRTDVQIVNCRVERQPDGSSLVLSVQRMALPGSNGKSGGHARGITLYHYRTDGSLLTAMTYISDPADPARSNSMVTDRPDLPLTEDQLRQVVLDDRLRF